MQAWCLTAREERAYRDDGFFFREAMFGGKELVRLRAAAERAGKRAEALLPERTADYCIDGNRYVEAGGARIQFEHRPGSATLRVLQPFHHLDPHLERLIDDPRMVQPMRGLLGCQRISLFTDKLNFKRPHEGSGFRWHQDSPYWAFACDRVDRLPNVMLVLDAADETNGCLRLVRGSHRNGMLRGLDSGRLGPLFTDPSEFDATAQVPAVLSAGSLVFFHPHLVHGSEPNRSKRPRRALVLTYQPGLHPMFERETCREAGGAASAPVSPPADRAASRASA